MMSETDVQTTPEEAATAPIKVFVQLSALQNASDWQRKWEAGDLIGINDPTPYGFGRANQMGCTVEFSSTHNESKIGKFVRLVFRAILGFDYLHAVRNTKAALASDIVWTYTASQFLGIALVLALRGKKKPHPRLLGQSIWLFDRWPKLDPLRKALYRRLINDYVDCLMVHSPSNLVIARDLFPDKPVELVRFFIPTEARQEPVARHNTPHRIICLGNDRHRDWRTAIKAFGDQDGIELKIFSTQVSESMIGNASNIEVRRIKTNDALKEELSTASLMVIPLQPNLHASGTTVLQESVIFGLPVVVSKTGGLEAYFDDTCATFVPTGDAEAMRAAALELLNAPDKALAKAIKAQTKLKSGEIGADVYVRHHVTLSQMVLGLPRDDA